MSTIPASEIVNSVPGVLGTGGNAIDLNGLMLTPSWRIPVGTVEEFDSLTAVEDFFGATSVEASFAEVYFAGYTNAPTTPGSMLAAQYNQSPVSAWLRGGNLAADTTLTQLQGFSGTLSVTIDGTLKTGNINLSGVTSFTNAAELIAAGLGIEGAQVAAFTGSITGTTLTVTAFTEGEGDLEAGCVLNGVGVTANTYIVAQLTSTEANGSNGGTGTYQVSTSQTVESEAMTADQPAVQFDSVSGAFVIWSGTTGAESTITFGSGALATDLLLTQAASAVISQGAAAAAQAPFMNSVIAQNTDWATFFLTFNPDQSGQITQRLAFAQWAAQQNNRYAYIEADSDAGPATENPDTASFAQQLKALGYSGTSPNWQSSETYLAAFISGTIASIDFDQAGGRITLDGRQQSGLSPSVTDQTTAENLIANGYNFYGAYGTAKATFIRYTNGSVSGPFTWLDSLVNAIWLTNNFQVDLMTLRQNTNAIPYNAAGAAMIEEALKDTIKQGLAFGAYSAGVTLSGSQIAAVNAAAGGLNIAPTLSNQGWYLLVGQATPQVRQARGSPPITFFYCDGGAVQQINMQSTALL